MATDQAHIFALANQSSRFFGRFGGFRSKHDLDFADVFVFLALGRLNFDDSLGGKFIRPASITSMASFLGIPRETLRRKLNQLVERDLVQRSNYGFVIKDVMAWRRLAELIAQNQLVGSEEE